MFFGNQHDFRGSSVVKQILVFTTENVQKQFEKHLKERIEARGVKHADDNNIGAIYKLRAILTTTGEWRSVVLCGFDGSQLHEHPETFKTPEEALDDCKRWLSEHIKLSGVIDL